MCVSTPITLPLFCFRMKRSERLLAGPEPELHAPSTLHAPILPKLLLVAKELM